MKRIVSVLILLCMIVSAYADDPIKIWTKADLIAFRNAVNGGNNYEGKTVKLMADIIVDDGWVPIGVSDNVACSFKGTFEGQGYTISITISTSVYPALGLFGYLHGIVQHLKVDGQFIITEKSLTTCVGGIAGYNKGTISECANLAKIIGTTAGGIAGENNGTITNCYNRGNILATGDGEGTYYLGGIAGAFNGTAISNVYASCGKMDNAGTPGGIVSNNQSVPLSICFYDVTWNGSTDKMTGSITLTGNALKASFDNDIWTFTDGQLPELTCFKNKIVRLSETNDNSAILTSYHNQTCTVELSGRTLYKDGAWNTLCLPFDLALSGSVLDEEGVVAKVLDSSGTSLDGKGLLTLSFTDAPLTILAGTPFIIKWNNTGIHLTNVQFSNVTLNNTAPTPVTFDNAFGASGQFVGTYSPFSIDAGNIDKIVLLSGDNTLGYSKNPRTLRSCRAHFMIPTSSSIRAMMDFDIDFDGGESTGVAALNDNGEMIHDNDGWYTLTGVKLDGKPTERGIYLHNGRKEAVR
ncbi:MAG: hypothetical protein K6A93_08190 [Bacteroidaceae bacterium]|nr:hypothetical protein [Bacteroidaceae bacterium]